MPTNDFTVKRGMVFYLDSAGEQQCNVTCQLTAKSRPYLVVSNDVVNDRASIVHVLPITSQPPRAPHMPWMVPFKKRDGSVNWVRTNEATCIPKKLLTCANYSESFSNIICENKGFMSRVTEMIARHFAIISDGEELPTPLEDQLLEDHRDQVEAFQKTTDSVCANSESEQIAFCSADSITVSFSIGGIGPVQFTIGKNAGTPTQNVSESPVESDVEESTTVVKEDHAKKTKGKYVGVSGNLTTNGIKAIINTIANDYKGFGGTMSVSDISRMFGICGHSVECWVRKVSDAIKSGNDPMSVVTRRRNKRVMLSDSMKVKFIHDYKNLSLDSMYKKYKKYGFGGTDHIFSYYKYISAKMHKEESVTA